MVADCVWCKVHRCLPQVPQMAPHRVQRVTPHLRLFSAVGVAYLGPVTVTIGRRSEKRWVALFTCLAVRAVHLEVVHSLSTQSCLMAIRRFVCKRGMPQEFFSDNRTNFLGASKEISKVARRIDEECAEAVVSSSTKWDFNPPGTPHMGGVWERMVDGPFQLADALRDVYRRSQYLADRMWERWYKEYLPGINRRTKWCEERRPLNVGDLVFVINGQYRKAWIRGEIMKKNNGHG
ncbi:uncharacterized protein LOC134222552 [Armigeres subalbatus]|uniref:uncharacterized protein LOC134222552 n=1 Tax=Armigeres subalbatus TaxID=124917 RepID=UPI002ECFD958